MTATHCQSRTERLLRSDRAACRCVVPVAVLLMQSCVLGALAAEEAVRLAEEAVPILESKCVACHGSEKQEGGLRLDSLAAAKTGGDLGPAVVPGDVDRSPLVRAITFRDPDLQMPPRKKLTEHEIDVLTRWVREGAPWPEPVAVLFEDEPQFLAALTSGNGRGRLVSDGAFSGAAALGMPPLQRDAANIPGWRFAIRERPRPGEYRYLRFAWKKRGEGSVMLELATDGRWPDAQASQGRYVAGPNTTGWAASSVAETAPTDWTVVTVDLWRDLGEVTLSGIAPTCDRGDEAFFDAILLGPSLASLDAYRPPLHKLDNTSPAFGNALTDERNPIRTLFHGERLDLWSLRHPAASPVALAGDARDASIDSLLDQRRSRVHLARSPEADRRTLIRRMTFDLTGLPPTPAEVDAFLHDDSPRAYEQLVDRLLASPHYGERQASLWLDVVRYADTNGYERDEFRPLMWQYRDYVVRSFNQDKPFDQFIREQLAGDHLVTGPPRTPAEVDMLVATGFLRLGQWDSTASIFQEETRLRAEMLADVTNTTASAFLGLTFACCQCHDHKYDPFSQADHYRLRAFFAGMEPRDDLPISLAAEQAEIDAHNDRLDQEVAPLQTELAQREQEEASTQQHAARIGELKGQIAAIDAQRRQPQLAMSVTESAAPPPTFVLYQGDHASPREEVTAGFPTVLGSDPDVTAPRRLALAEWITSPDNPWTARVIVNRVWQQHFGTGLVATPNDFGYSGARPTHPELLDWLALEFLRRGWSLKELHRLIVTSAAYRQGSGETSTGRTVDPENHWLWRQNMRRLDAETLRDSLLAVSGLLRTCAGGKPLWPEVPEELLHAQPAILEAIEGKDGGRMQGWTASPLEETDVRSLYLIRKRCLPVPFLQVFDLPDSTVSCARRDTTVVAPQALTLLNSPDTARYAHALADRVWNAGPPPDLTDPDSLRRVVRTLFQLTLARDASADEQALAAEFLKRHHDLHAAKVSADQALRRALTDLSRAVLNLNEFLYID